MLLRLLPAADYQETRRASPDTLKGDGMEQWTEGLALRMKEGDQEAFDELMEHFYPRLLPMAYLITGSHGDSEDVVQETFVRCWLNRERLREPRYFAKWLYRIMTREAWRVCRQKKKEQPVEEVFGTETPVVASALEEVMENTQREELYQAIAGLPVKQRTVVVLYYYNDMSTKEIAGVMGCLEGTVKSRLYTARQKLKQILSEDAYLGKEAAL